ncbi:MAG: DsbA family protein [Solirubrobacteraceae bacterium]
MTDHPEPDAAPLPVTRWPGGGAAADGVGTGEDVAAGHGRDTEAPVHAGRVGDDHGHGQGPDPADGGVGDGIPDPEGPPAFYFDFRDPESYLAAERVMATLPVATPWVPIDASRLPGPHAWEGFRCEHDEDAWRECIARTAGERGLQPLHWPPAVPFDSTLALRAAWYAKGLGRVVSVSLPAFRQAYAGGHDLATESFVLIAASAAEMHPRAVLQAMDRAPIIDALTAATDRAIERGVRTVPAVWTGDRVFHGDDGIDAAAAALAERLSGD